MTDPLVADRVRVDEVAGGTVRLSCRVRSPVPHLPAEIWFDLPSSGPTAPPARGDAFLPALLCVAMRHHLDLRLEADVSPALMTGAGRIAEIFQDWGRRLGHGMSSPQIRAPLSGPVRHPLPGAAFFSGGVDSFFTLVRNLGRYDLSDPRRIRFLILVHGLDIPLDRTDFFAEVSAHASRVAADFGVELVPVRTNVRPFTRDVDWAYYANGPCLASVGLACQHLASTVFIGSSYWSDCLGPWGSHPGVDPLWSSEAVEFVHDGFEATRFDKVRLIAGSPLALRSLRVCWQNRGGLYNCGRCEKCLRTVFALHLCGALQHAQSLPPTLDVSLIRQLNLAPGGVPFWEDNLDAARRLRAAPELIEAIERAIGRARWRHSRAGKVDEIATRLLARLGLRPETLRRLDARLAGGRLEQIFARLQRTTGR